MGNPPVDFLVAAVFAAVYLSMILGRIPGLALDRTGAALLGAIALLSAGRVTTDQAWASVDTSTIALLLGLMVVSAQFRLSGFYSRVVRSLAQVEAAETALLAGLIVVSGVLSAVLANDIVCLAMAPVLAEGCFKRGIDPVPFLLALACSANVGSAATLIGNPQNMLIGQVLGLSFSRYILQALLPSVLGLAVVWAVVAGIYRGRWRVPPRDLRVKAPPYSRWQTAKGLVLTGAMVVMFTVTPLPREMVALAAAGILLCSRRMRSREILGLVDWQLIVLFVSLFVLNGAMADSGNSRSMVRALSAAGLDLEGLPVLFAASALLSNLVSNVPAVMLLLPSAGHPGAGVVLALSSTLAGNLLLVGSIANIIVVDQAARLGIKITWRDHARVGIPVTALTLAIAAASLAAML